MAAKAKQAEAEVEDKPEAEDGDQRAPGMGEQPEAREIPIAASPPEG